MTSTDRAMRIKEDVIENLNITHSTWQGEKRQRELLQEHIRSITELVRKMDKDIKVGYILQLKSSAVFQFGIFIGLL